MSVSIVIPGRPLSVNRVYMPLGRGRTVMTKEGRRFVHLVSVCAKEAMGDRPPFKVPLRMDVTFFFDRKIEGTELPMQDRDGPLKPLQDGLNGIVYEDDKWVMGGLVEKEYDARWPRTELRVTAL